MYDNLSCVYRKVLLEKGVVGEVREQCNANIVLTALNEGIHKKDKTVPTTPTLSRGGDGEVTRGDAGYYFYLLVIFLYCIYLSECIIMLHRRTSQFSATMYVIKLIAIFNSYFSFHLF